MKNTVIGSGFQCLLYYHDKHGEKKFTSYLNLTGIYQPSVKAYVYALLVTLWWFVNFALEFLIE